MSLPRYPAYKDSGVPWLGEVPAHWGVKRLKQLCRIYGGATPASGDDSLWDGDIAWATPADLGKTSGLHLETTQRTISAKGLESCAANIVPAGSIILSTRAPIGSIGISSGDICTNQGCKSLVPTNDARALFLARYLSVVTKELEVAGRGTTFLELSADELGRFMVPTPPLAEQEAIAAFLDRETARVDALVAEQGRLIALLKEKRQAVISHAVTRGLNPDAPRKTSGVAWLGDVPAHWETVSSRRIFRVRNEPAAEGDRQLTASQKYGVVFQSDFVESEGRRVVEVIKGESSLKHVEPNDFIISMRSFQGGIEWCRHRGSTSWHYVVIVPIKWVWEPFFAHLLKSQVYIQALRSTTDLIRDGQELRFSHFVLVDLPLVPMEEQKAIADFLDRETSAMDALIAEAERAVALLGERRAALIAAAVTGRVDVRGVAAGEGV